MGIVFPKGFYFGTATSAHQVEGNNTNNDWWQAEQASTVPYKSGRACDSYNRYEEDFDLAREMNNNAHRFSIEWSRVEPEEGKFSEEAVEHYRAVIRALKARGLEPFVTLHHYTNPVWFAQKGGWLRQDAPEYFARYVQYVATRLGADVRYWITINEPSIYAFDSFSRGKWPPHHHNFFESLTVLARMRAAHSMAAERLHSVNGDFRVGIAHAMNHFEPVGTGLFYLLNRASAAIASFLRNYWLVGRIFDSCDFIGLNYYHTYRVLPWRLYEEGPYTDFGWGIQPRGVYHLVKELKKYGKPIFVTENGLADADDDQRSTFIRDHLVWLHRAMEEGADVRGYFYWSLLDNFEWSEGFRLRFGLVEVDFDTLKRTPRPSARVYGEICENNGT